MFCDYDDDFEVDKCALAYAARQVAIRAAADGGDYGAAYQAALLADEDEPVKSDEED